MTGFWVLARKEVLEQRRTKKFLALVVVFTLVAVLSPSIFAIVLTVQDEPRGLEQAREILSEVGGGVIPALGTFLAIVITMGALANERATGTAAMTLSKPVTRSAFVSAKFLGLLLSIFGAMVIAAATAYVLTLILFADVGLGRFALGIVVSATYLLFIGSVTLFFSAFLTRQLLVGGIAFVTYIVLNILRVVPHAERYLPVASPEWSLSIIRSETNDYWPAFAIACGLIVVLNVAAWAVFRGKEL